MVRRRDFLKMTLAAGAVARAESATQIPATGRLRGLATTKGLLVGSAVSYRELQDPAFTALLADEGNIVVCENEMKWAIVQPERSRFDFGRGDALLSFAGRHGQKLRGHNLCWHEQLPGWFPQLATHEDAGDLLRAHVAAVAGYYSGHIHSWDVVNEAIRVEDGRPDGLRNSLWLQLLGREYIGIAFRTAAQADPQALLTYNDYDIEQDGPKFDAKRQAVLRLLTWMRDQNIPIQAVGLQSHLKAGAQAPNWAALDEFMLAVEKLGLQIFITELDVDDSTLTPDVKERDEQVAAVYYGYLHNVLQHRSVKAVLTWGLTDRDSWLNAPNRRHEGPLRRGLPFDAELQPKPAYQTMVKAISEAPPR